MKNIPTNEVIKSICMIPSTMGLFDCMQTYASSETTENPFDEKVYKISLNDINYHFHYFFYLKKEIVDKKVKRYIAEINYVTDRGKIIPLYQRKKNEHKYFNLPDEALEMLENSEDLLKQSVFVRKEENEK